MTVLFLSITILSRNIDLKNWLWRMQCFFTFIVEKKYPCFSIFENIRWSNEKQRNWRNIEMIIYYVKNYVHTTYRFICSHHKVLYVHMINSPRSTNFHIYKTLLSASRVTFLSKEIFYISIQVKLSFKLWFGPYIYDYSLKFIIKGLPYVPIICLGFPLYLWAPKCIPNKCSDRSMEVYLPPFQKLWPTDRPTGRTGKVVGKLHFQ